MSARPLVVLCANRHGLHVENRWRSLRMWLVWYDDPALVDAEGAERVYFAKGTKWELIRGIADDILAADPAPPFVFFPDDDLRLSAEDVDTFFACMASSGADMGQPSLLPINASHPDLVQIPNGPPVRPAGLVEIQMPCVHRRLLPRFLDFVRACARYRSGWGYDHVWSAWPGVRKVVVDAVAAEHTRPVDIRDPDSFYRRFDIDPVAECEFLLEEFRGK